MERMVGKSGAYGAYGDFNGKPERKRPLGRHRRRCEDSIKMDFTELVWGSLDWIYVAWNRDSSRLL